MKANSTGNAKTSGDYMQRKAEAKKIYEPY